MEEKIKFCPYCGTPLEDDYVACPKCGHFLNRDGKLENTSKPAAKEEVKVSEVDYSKSVGKPKVTKNGPILGNAITSFIFLLLFIGAEIGVFLLLKMEIAKSFVGTEQTEPFTILFYVFLGVLLLLPWFFLIPNGIAGAAIKKSKGKTKNGLYHAGLTIAIISRILAILMIFVGLALFIYIAIVMGPYIFKGIGDLISGGMGGH